MTRGFLKGLFGGGGGGSAPPPRRLETVDDLRIGDVIRFALDSRPEISGREFQVMGVHGYDFQAGSGDERAVLELGEVDGKSLFLWRHAEPGGNAIAVAYAALEPEVIATLDMDEFPQLFEGSGRLVTVQANGPRARGNPWLAPLYRQEFAQDVYRMQGDPRLTRAGYTVAGNETAVDFYRLVSADRRAAIEVIVHDGGRTDVLFVSYLPSYKIEEMLPAT